MRSPRARRTGASGTKSQLTSGGKHLIPVAPCQASSLGERAAEIGADMRFREKARRLYARGPRLIVELLAHVAADRALGT